jgi:hypothetical protein
VPTRGVPAGFQSGLTGLIDAIHVADAAAARAKAALTLYDYHSIASVRSALPPEVFLNTIRSGTTARVAIINSL